MIKTTIIRRAASGFLAAVCATSLAVPAAAAPVPVADFADAPSASGAQCRDHWFAVSNPGGPDHQVYGQMCTRSPADLGRQPLQILLHGGSYNHTYYDWPYQPERYNYVRYMTQRGYTTLNLDRLGYGYSDHPSPETLNFDVAAANLHEIVQVLRRGGLGPTFEKIVLNGYSMGGLTAQVEAARYRDVDGIAVHAVGHGLLTPRSASRLSAALYPAAADPKFRDRPWARNPNYLTSLPGKRDLFFGPASTFDPAQLAYEDEHKDTVSSTELADITWKTYTELTRDITAPVLWTPGQFDKIWCATTDDCSTDPMTAREPEYYRQGVLTAAVIPNTGHATLLGYGGEEYLRRVVQWLHTIGV